MSNNIENTNAFGANRLSTVEQTDGAHAFNVVLMNQPMRDLQVLYAAPVGGSTGLAMTGGAMQSIGTGATISTPFTPGAANYTRFRRTRATGSAAAGNAAAAQMSYTRFFRGANGGFDASIQFGQGADVTGFSAFVGMGPLTTALATADPTTLLNCVGVGYTSTDAAGGTWFLINNDGSGAATKTAIPGMTRSTTAGYNLRIICPQGATSAITVLISDAHTGASILSTTLNTDLPTADTSMSFGANQFNGAIASSAIMDVSRVYVTCNY